MPTGAIIYALGAIVRSRESTFTDTTENVGMLAVQAGSNTVFQSQDCQFVGWIGNNVVSVRGGRLRFFTTAGLVGKIARFCLRRECACASVRSCCFESRSGKYIEKLKQHRGILEGATL